MHVAAATLYSGQAAGWSDDRSIFGMAVPFPELDRF
jgi:hypothetical protein